MNDLPDGPSPNFDDVTQAGDAGSPPDPSLDQARRSKRSGRIVSFNALEQAGWAKSGSPNRRARFTARWP